MSFSASSRKGGDLSEREMSHQHHEFIITEHAEADARAKCHRPCKCCPTIMYRELGKLVLELDEAIVGTKVVAHLIATQLKVYCPRDARARHGRHGRCTCFSGARDFTA